jgi:hypothetical protein
MNSKIWLASGMQTLSPESTASPARAGNHGVNSERYIELEFIASRRV